MGKKENGLAPYVPVWAVIPITWESVIFHHRANEVMGLGESRQRASTVDWAWTSPRSSAQALVHIRRGFCRNCDICLGAVTEKEPALSPCRSTRWRWGTSAKCLMATKSCCMIAFCGWGGGRLHSPPPTERGQPTAEKRTFMCG
jgi:hypothetical protein